MRRNNLFRSLIAVFLLLWAAYSLYPSFELMQQRSVADKYFAELMDGKMTAKNNRNGRGCTFTFSFPKVLPEENQEDSQKNAS